MDSPIPATPGPRIQVRAAPASTVIVHRPPPERVERFLELQHEIARAAAEFPGYRSTEVFPPADSSQPEWVILLHFEDAGSLQGWLDSPTRAAWVRKLRGEIGEYQLKTLPGGLGAWFLSQMVGATQIRPPGWKMAVTVLLGLYPTVMLLSILVAPRLTLLGVAGGMLVSNALSICMLQWGVMPALNRALGPWLGANEVGRRGFSLGGLGLILLLLAGMALLFRLITG